jgi:hypothetical protein
MDRFTKACLVLIIVLLAVIAVRPIVFPQAVAAQQHYRYIAVRLLDLGTSTQPELDKYAADGWELVDTYVATLNSNGQVVFALP